MHEHWTEVESGLLEKVTTFEGLADIALTILARMKKQGQPIVQICGPMSTGGFGDLAQNMVLFEYAMNTAVEHGLIVFNQMPFQDAMIRIANWKPNQSYCTAILEVFYKKVFESGCVNKTLFIPDWQSSHGATWERKLVTELGIVVEEYPVEWLVSARIIRVLAAS